MSNNFQFLNDLITFDDKTDDLLEEKIRENEAKIQALEKYNTSVKNSNLSKKSENLEKTPYFPSKGPDNIINFNSEETFSLKEESNNSNFSNKNSIIKIEPIITPLKKEKEKINENNNSSLSTKLNNNTSNISNINSSNNKSLNLNMNISINSENKKTSNNKGQENSKINSKQENIHSLTIEKRRNARKKVSNFKSKNDGKDTNDNNYLYDNIDQSLYYQYVTFLSNEKNINKSAEKRSPHRNKISNNLNKSDSNSKDKSINDEKFSTTYQRFLDDDKKKKEKLEKMKKKKEEQDKKIYLYKPEINKKSKEIASKNKEDFYTRQKKLMEQKQKKEALLHDKFNKKEKDDKYKNRKKSVEETINKLYEWESRRKEKINKKIEKKEKEMEKEIQKMKAINKKSYKIKVKRNPNHAVNRLYKLDVAKRKVKQEILDQLFSPTFQPIVSQNLSQIKISTNRNSYINKKDTIEENNTMISMGMKNPNVSSCNFLTTNHKENVSDDEKVDQLIRDRVFSKIKKKARYQSAMKFNVVKNNNDFVNYNSDNFESDNDENRDLEDNNGNNYNENISSSYMQRTIKKINVP